MRRTVVIDDKLLEEARQALGTRSIRDTVETALRGAVRRRRLDQLRRSLGNVVLDQTGDELLRMRDELCRSPSP